MLATFDSLNGQSLLLRMPLAAFLRSPVMRTRARLSFCTPEELVADHIPAGADPDDPEETAQCIAEACEAASGCRVSHIALEPPDLRYVRRHLKQDRHGLRLAARLTPPEAV
jgi:hypothetical protein